MTITDRWIGGNEMTKTTTRSIRDLDKRFPNGVKRTVSQQELLDLKEHGFTDEYINKHFKKFVSACEFEHYPFEKPFHDIYKKELCISPMPSLAVHFTNINSIYGLSPLINYEKLWKENKL